MITSFIILCGSFHFLFCVTLLVSLINHGKASDTSLPSTLHSTISQQSLSDATLTLAKPKWSPRGYLLYCPCMGRFGNQIDQFLGAIEFTKQLGRVLILPHFVEYPIDHPLSRIFPPFSTIFNVSTISQYLEVIDQPTFIHHFYNDQYWPKEKRISFCFQPSNNGCEFRHGQPSTDFWTLTVNQVTFSSSKSFEGMGFDPNGWKRFSAAEYPVIALAGAPASFPVAEEHRSLQRYLEWNDDRLRRIRRFINARLPRPYVGIHLRLGEDWANSCTSAVGLVYSYMESAQCLNRDEKVTKQLCYPSNSHIVKKVVEAVKALKAKSVFVSADVHGEVIGMLLRALGTVGKKFGWPIIVVRDEQNDLYTDLGLLIESDHFIGNCVSSFTGFVKRKRDVSEPLRTTSFFGRHYQFPSIENKLGNRNYIENQIENTEIGNHQRVSSSIDQVHFHLNEL